MERSRRGFDFTSAMHCLCADVVERHPALRHVDVSRVAFNVCQTRQATAHGMYASLTPLRFELGATSKTIRGTCWEVEPLCDGTGKLFLYMLSFYLPRFMNVSLEEKLSTIFHELWHIGPQFDGDVRRLPGRCYAHGPSQRQYDAAMDRMAQEWLAHNPPCHLYDFLLHDFASLKTEYGGVHGSHWPAPRLIRKRA